MIVYQRNLRESDFNNIEEQEIIYYKNNNIAFIIRKKDNIYFVSKYKIFNKYLIKDFKCKTIYQCLKI